MDFSEFITTEEYKNFPKDKVNRKIEKKDKKAKDDPHSKEGVIAKRDAHVMKAVKNYKTKLTDYKKQFPSETNKQLNDRHREKLDKKKKEEKKSYEKAEKQYSKAEKAVAKGREKKAQKHLDKGNKHTVSGNRHNTAARAMRTVAHATGTTTPDEDTQQAKKNVSDRENVKRLKSSLKRTKLEKDLKDSPSLSNESLFSDFLNDLRDPLYEVLGVDDTTTAASKVKCPVGYKWNPMTLRCEPKTERDSVAGDKGQKMPHGQAHYNVIGSSGYDGGWAFQEPPSSMDMNPDH